MEETKQFRKNFIWNILGTGLNAFNSLFFLITVTRINGLNEAGIFTLAYSTACIMFVIGVYVGRIYHVTEPNQNISNKDYIVNRIISIIIMGIAIVAFCLIRGYNFYKSLIFFLLTLYKMIECFAEVFYGIIQKNEKLELVGKSLFSKSLLSIICFVIVDYFTKNVVLSIVSVLIVWIVIFLIYDLRNCKQYIDFKEKANKENIISIFKLGFTTFAISFLGYYLINAPKYAIDNYLSSDLQTIYGIIVMPATIVALVAQFLINPFLTQILKAYVENNLKNLNKVVHKLILYIMIFGMFSTILAYFLGTWFLGLIYGLNLGSYKLLLATIIISATLYTVGTIYSSVLITVRETFPQFIIYIIISVFALIIANILTNKYGITGAVWAYTATMVLYFIIYTIYTNIRLKYIFAKKGRVNEQS